MTDMDKAATDTSVYEGYKANPYKDSRGLWTVGEGTCLETTPISGKDLKYLLDNKLLTISLSGTGARWLLRSYLAQELGYMAAHFPGFSALPDLAQTLLVEMAYQLGGSNLIKWGTFCTLVTQHRFQEAAADGRKTAWYSQTPERAEKVLAQLEGIK